MDQIIPAILVLLACDPDAQSCSEMRLSETYANIEACRVDLPAALRKLSRQERPIIGRCESTSNDSGVDPMVTGSLDTDVAIVRVTRNGGGRLDTKTYRVPKAGR